MLIALPVSQIVTRTIYRDFFSAAGFENRLPGSAEGFVPQGVTATGDGAVRIVCGYMNNDHPSRVYVLRGADNKIRVDLFSEDGTPYTGHAGGITAAGEYVYISNAHKLFVLRLADLLGADDKAKLSFIGHIEVPVNASYCSSDGKMIYVGEFHAEGYDTDESHRTVTADGTYQAWTVGYRLDPEAPLGVAESYRPAVTYAMRDDVQGFAVLPDGRVALSCSHGYSSSHLFLYKPEAVKKKSAKSRIVILDSTCLESEMKMPRMSEDLEYRENRLLMSFESGAMKFGAGLIPGTTKRLASFLM